MLPPVEVFDVDMRGRRIEMDGESISSLALCSMEPNSTSRHSHWDSGFVYYTGQTRHSFSITISDHYAMHIDAIARRGRSFGGLIIDSVR